MRRIVAIELGTWRCRKAGDIGFAAFPARAGMNRRPGSIGLLLRGVPRTRGDEPAAEEIADVVIVRSPHARG